VFTSASVMRSFGHIEARAWVPFRRVLACTPPVCRFYQCPPVIRFTIQERIDPDDRPHSEIESPWGGGHFHLARRVDAALSREQKARILTGVPILCFVERSGQWILRALFTSVGVNDAVAAVRQRPGFSNGFFRVRKHSCGGSNTPVRPP